MESMANHCLAIILIILGTMALSYSREELFNIQRQCHGTRLPHNLYQTIVDYGISRVKPTKRGHRAFTKTQHFIPVIQESVRQVRQNVRACDSNNLIHIRPVTEFAKFCTVNLQSIRNKTTQFVDFVTEQAFDIVALTETWLKPDDDLVVKEATPSGYSFVHVPRDSRPGGGVGLLYRSDLRVRTEELQTFPSFEALHAQVTDDHSSFRLVIVYRSERSSEDGQHVLFTSFLDDFSKLMDYYLLHPSKLLLTGDFNIWMDDAAAVNTVHFTELLSSYGMTQYVTTPTHRHGHTLDLLITRDGDNVISDISVHPGLSDHFAITCKLILQKPRYSVKTVTTRNFKGMDRDFFQQRVSEALSSIDVENIDLSKSVEEYERSLRDILDVLAPLKTRRLNPRQKSPWFNEEIREAKKVRRRLERKWRKCKSSEEGKLQHKRYHEQCRIVTKLIKNAKRHFYSSAVESCTSDQKALFAIIDELLQKKSAPILPQSQSEGTLANSFSEHFMTKINKIRDAFVNNQNIGERTTLEVPYMVDFVGVSEDEVEKLIKRSPSSSCQQDPIPTWLIKENVRSFVPFITRLVNRSFTAAAFPENLKHAIIRPLLKKPSLDKERLASYRPVANLKYLGKVIERVAATRILGCVVDQSIQDPFQSAYRKNHSVETAVLRVTNDILQSMDRGMLTGLVLLDLSAAFDTVDHRVMQRRLQEVGIGGSALSWCQSYLDGRTQAVRIGEDDVSDPVLLNCSVPQGSVLGPQLFSIYVLPICDIITRHDIMYHIYADDIQLYVSCQPNQTDVDETVARFESCIADISEWMGKNFLQINQAKTEFIVFGSSQQMKKVTIPDLKVGEVSVTRAPKVRSLGLTLDSKMSMEPQISSCIRSCVYHIQNIRRIRDYLTPHATKQAVHSLVTSRLDMYNSTLNGLPESQIKRLQKIQNSAARLITRSRVSAHITPVLRDLHWLPVRQRIKYKILSMVFKLRTNKTPMYLADLLQEKRCARLGLRSGNSHQFQEARTKRSWGDRSFLASAPRLWNALPPDIKSSGSVTIFHKSLKTYLMNETYG